MSRPVSQDHRAAFIRWFGSSKVVEPNGAPLVVYRGECGHVIGHNPFDVTQRGTPTFTDDRDMASCFAEQADAGVVGAYYLAIRHPLNLTDNGFVLEKAAFWGDIDSNGAYRARLRKRYPEFEVDGVDAFFVADDPVFVALARRAGFDGLQYLGSNFGESINEFRPFQPEQIKSAIGNSGAFDPANPDICDSRPEAVRRMPSKPQPVPDEDFCP